LMVKSSYYGEGARIFLQDGMGTLPAPSVFRGNKHVDGKAIIRYDWEKREVRALGTAGKFHISHGGTNQKGDLIE